ncbi:MAG: translation initiation factor IF-3, partial [Acidobacteria bacterium]|nr:translation initiation factor IF-3 [Acidobacteriota bacterium]
MRRPRGRAFVPVSKDTVRVNDRIRKSPVRMIDADGTQVGIIPLEEARRRAEEQNLDLVEVGAEADPPVVKVMDWGKTRFEKEKRAKESKKRAAVIDVKEVKFRPTIGDNDFFIKAKRAIQFLKKGKKVKVTVF